METEAGAGGKSERVREREFPFTRRAVKFMTILPLTGDRHRDRTIGERGEKERESEFS